MQATGKIRNYQIGISFILLLNVPLTYIALNTGHSPNSILIIQIIVSFFTLIVRLFFSWHYAYLKISDYLKKVLIPIGIVTLFAVPVPFYVSVCLIDDWRKLLITLLVSFVSVITSVVLFGMNKQERESIIQFIIKKIRSKEDES
jgi:hypothetical protein